MAAPGSTDRNVNLNALEMAERDARFHAEIMVLGQIRDTLINVSTSLQDVRERVVRIESSDASAKIAKLDGEVTAYEKSNNARMNHVELQIAKWSGVFLPVTIAGTAALSAIIAFLINYAMKGA